MVAVGRPMVLLVVVLLSAAVVWQPAGAAFTAATSNGANALAAAGSFPTYPASVTGNSPWAYHRGDDAVSSSATSTAADSSGNSRAGTYGGMTNGPSTYWSLDEGSGTVVADASGAANPGTLVGAAATWTTGGRSGNAVALDGTSSSWIQGAGPAVTTSASFSVSAWAYLTDTGGYRTIVSQDGTTVSGFYLQYHHLSNRWCLTMLPSDADSPTSVTACSTAAPTLSTWTHLVGTYDSVAGNIKLYLNGVLQATTAHAAWSAAGNLVVGAGLFSGTRTDRFTGRVDEVRTYRRALSATEVGDLYGDNPSLQYDFEENTGTTTADLSGNANSATFGAGAAWTTAGHRGNALSLGVSATAYAQSTSAPVDATASFSISAWVKLNTSGAVTRTVVSQQGTNYDTFILKYESSGKWAFILMQNSAGVADQVLSTVNASFNTWVHLVAVYDTAAAAGAKMKLYVNNGTPVVGPHATAYGTTNPIQVGRTRWGGVWTDPWDGSIDELRTYRRALTTTEISYLYNPPPATATMTARLPGALQGSQQGQQSATAVAFNGTYSASNNTLVAAPGPTTFTIECWFKIAPGDAGTLIGYNTIATGLGGSYDRVIYLDTNGKLRFGVNPGAVVTVVSPLSYNDGTWHHVAASLSGTGMKLYVDGLLVASNSGATTAGSYAGYWRWGGHRITGWPSRPDNGYLVGTLDEVAVYTQELTAQQIAWHYYANH